MKLSTLVLALAPAAALAADPTHFTVTASFVPPKAGAEGAVSVTFSPKDPEIHVNEDPAPRLKLDPAQTLLKDRQPPPPTRIAPFDPEKARYLDAAVPVLFPVAWAAGAPKSPQTVSGSVTYFYCSKREGWCRKGTTDIEVRVP